MKLIRSLSAVAAGMMLMLQPVGADPDELMAEARQYLADGDTAAAVIQLKNALREAPANIEARLMLGTVYLYSGDARGAQKEFERAGRLGAPNDRWMVGLAQTLAMQNDMRSLLDKVVPDQTMSAKPRAEALAFRGDAYLALGEREQAGEAYAQALAVDTGNSRASLGQVRLLLAEQKRDEARAALDRIVNADPEHVESLILRGELARNNRDLDSAIADFTRAIELSQVHANAYLGRALAYLGLGRLEAAGSDIDMLARRAGNAPVVAYVRALLAYQQRDFERASDQLQVVLRASPGNLQAQLLYGVVSYVRGEYTVADDYLSRVILQMRDNVALTKLLGATRLKLRQPGKAIDAMEPVSAAAAADAQYLALLGTAHMQTGNNAKGAEYMEQAVAIAPDQAALRTQLALGRIAAGDTGSAISELESAVELGQDLVQADVLLVLSYLNRKEFDKALETAGQLEVRLVDSPIPANLTGLALLAQRKYDASEAKFREALQIDPAFNVARMNLARTFVARKKLLKASDEFKKILEQDPGHLGALTGLATVAAELGNTRLAIERLERAVEANPDAIQAVALLAEMYLRGDDALKAISIMKGLDAKSVSSPAIQRLMGIAQLQLGQPSNAVHSFEAVVKRAPKSLEGWFQLGRAQTLNGDYNGARDSFRKSIELDTAKQHPVIWGGLAELVLKDGNPDEALEVAQEMQRHFPAYAPARDLAAAALLRLDRPSDAVTQIRQAMALQPSGKRVRILAQSLDSIGQHRAAISELDAWLVGKPDDVASWTALAMLHQKHGSVEPAVKAYNKAIESGGDSAVLFNNLAWLQLDSNPGGALDYARRAYELSPQRAEIVDTYGWALFKSGKQADGLKTLQQALVIAPRSSEIAIHVAQALRAVNRSDEAVPLLERIIRDDPDSPYADQARRMLQ